MQAFDISNAGDFSDCHMNAVRMAMNTAKAGKPYAYLQYFCRESVTYYIPEDSESAEHVIAQVDTMVVVNPCIKTATVMNAQSHILWTVERNATHGYLLEQTIVQSGTGYGCWECGYGQATSFSRCPLCFMHNTCQPSMLQWVHTHRIDQSARH